MSETYMLGPIRHSCSSDASAAARLVSPLDLPGHGEVTATREVWKVATFGEDVAGLLDDPGRPEGSLPAVACLHLAGAGVLNVLYVYVSSGLMTLEKVQVLQYGRQDAGAATPFEAT